MVSKHIDFDLLDFKVVMPRAAVLAGDQLQRDLAGVGATEVHGGFRPMRQPRSIGQAPVIVLWNRWDGSRAFRLVRTFSP